MLCPYVFIVCIIYWFIGRVKAWKKTFLKNFIDRFIKRAIRKERRYDISICSVCLPRKYLPFTYS